MAPEKRELRATPAKIMEEGDADRRRHRPRMTAVVASPPRKAQRVTVPGELMVTAVPALAAFWAPASRAMMANAAPKAAPWDTPRVEAEASGLRRTFCITQPDSARAAPTTIATAMRGRRTWNTMARLWAVPPPVRVSASSARDSPAEPLVRDSRASAARTASSASVTRRLRRRKRR